VIIQQSLPRGIRNNNPGNIRRNNTRWQGMQTIQNDDQFVQFTNAEYGFRAMARILKTYERRGLITVRDIISTYAPKNENDTQTYVEFAANRLQVLPDQALDFNQYLFPLIKAITLFEQGATFASFYTDDSMREGIALA